MIRVFAIVAVLAAFGGALYLSGDYLQTWESPEPPANAAPAPPSKKKSKARPARPARKAKKESRRKNAWLVELNALCRQTRVELEEVPAPSDVSEITYYLRETGRLNRRWNHQGENILRRGGKAAAANELRKLFDRDEAAMQTMLTMAEKGRYQQLAAYARSLVPLAKAENRLLKKLGAVDCTVSPSENRLYEPPA